MKFERKFLLFCFWAWLAIWAFYIVRGLVKGEYAHYRALLPLPIEGKRAFTIGQDLYDFIKFCQENLPPDCKYDLLMKTDETLDLWRTYYYLLPRMQGDRAEYVLVYNDSAIPEGFELFARLAEDRYILKKKPETRVQ